MSNKPTFTPLDDLEVLDLLMAAYPEKFADETDETYEAALAFIDEVDVRELLGRVVMLTMPMKSGLTERWSHCLGKVTVKDGHVHMEAAVRRDFKP